jgi:hypothetical protein
MVLSPVTEVLRLAAEEKRASGAFSCLPVGGKIQIQIQIRIQGDTTTMVEEGEGKDGEQEMEEEAGGGDIRDKESICGE